MLVHEGKRALIMALRNAGKVTTVIPGAKILRQEPNRTLVAVKHTLDVVKVLGNIGIHAPSPIKHYYSWPSKYPKPMAHQVETAAFLIANTKAFCLNGMGSAKTLSSLWAFHYLKQENLVDIAIVVAPLSTLERTWADEVFQNFHEMECTVLHGTAARRKKLLSIPSDIYVINHDGIVVVQEELLALMKTKRCVLILDELAVFRNAKTRRWKIARAMTVLAQWAWGLTGTPIPNDPCNAYGQIKMLRPEQVPRSYMQFQDMVSRLVGPYKRVPKPGATETVYNLMQPAIRYATRDCVDLPPTTYVTRHAPLSEDQLAAYKRMRDQKVFQMTAGATRIVAANEAVVAMKMIQICCGAVIVSEDEAHARIESPARMEIVEDVIEQAEGKVIVFCPVLGAIDYIRDTLRAKGHKVGQVDGRIGKNDRDKVFSQFQGMGVDVIVAQPGAMAHGLTLTAGTVIIWYAPCYSNEIYEQANARIVRPGQKRNTLIVNVEGTELERAIYTRLKNRQAVQGKLLAMMEEG